MSIADIGAHTCKANALLSLKLDLQVLENPRYHTGQGYQTKASKYYNGK